VVAFVNMKYVKKQISKADSTFYIRESEYQLEKINFEVYMKRSVI
jgi:hypothetical protein